jgi:hypothetical protein
MREFILICNYWKLDKMINKEIIFHVLNGLFKGGGMNAIG